MIKSIKHRKKIFMNNKELLNKIKTILNDVEKYDKEQDKLIEQDLYDDTDIYSVTIIDFTYDLSLLDLERFDYNVQDMIDFCKMFETEEVQDMCLDCDMLHCYIDEYIEKHKSKFYDLLKNNKQQLFNELFEIIKQDLEQGID